MPSRKGKRNWRSVLGNDCMVLCGVDIAVHDRVDAAKFGEVAWDGGQDSIIDVGRGHICWRDNRPVSEIGELRIMG